jgi:hypothetical protein
VRVSYPSGTRSVMGPTGCTAATARRVRASRSAALRTTPTSLGERRVTRPAGTDFAEPREVPQIRAPAPGFDAPLSHWPARTSSSLGQGHWG